MKHSERRRFQIEGPGGTLPIKADDTAARHFAMLVAGECLGLGPSKAARLYGYTKQRYFQVRRAFYEQGSQGLVAQKRGPKHRSVRTPAVETQIIRHRFLDPDATARVIAQKLRQTGIRISIRSVERTISEYGLQKKTLRVSPERARPGGRHS